MGSEAQYCPQGDRVPIDSNLTKSFRALCTEEWMIGGRSNLRGFLLSERISLSAWLMCFDDFVCSSILFRPCTVI